MAANVPLATPRLARWADAGVYDARALDRPRFRSDMHLHTARTDGRSSIREMLDAAKQLGLSRVAFTEHVRRGTPWFDDFRAEIEALRLDYADLEILVGIEAKALDLSGDLDADARVIASADLVLGAFHNYPDLAGGFVAAERLGPDEATRREFEGLWALLDHPDVDVLAHPGALTRKFFGDFPGELIRELVFKAARVGRAIELNGEYNSQAELTQLLAWCREAGAWVTLGSNAHHSTEVGRIADRLVEIEIYAD